MKQRTYAVSLSVVMHIFVSILLAVLVLALESNSANDRKLVFVQILFRHGDRSPIELYPADPNPEDLWPEGLGKLTTLGKQQHYALGKYFRSMYANFTSFGPLEVSVISSDCDRCLKSAETNLASFFAPTKEWAFNENFHWQPISVHYLPKYLDKYLETDSFCPRAKEEQLRVLNSPEGQKFINEHEEMFLNLTTNSGMHIANWTEASWFHDTVFIEKKYDHIVPYWVVPWWDELTNVSNLAFFWSFNSPLLHRLRAGPFIQRTIDTMKAKVKGDTPHLKFQIYSAHDTTISSVLVALNLYNMIAPPYCSSLIFELYERTGGELLVRLLYQDSPQVEKEIFPPRPLILDGCTEFCPLNYFVNYTKNIVPENWEEECQLDKTLVDKIREKKVTVGWFFIIIAAIIICMSIFALWKIYSRKQEKENICILKGLHMDLK